MSIMEFEMENLVNELHRSNAKYDTFAELKNLENFRYIFQYSKYKIANLYIDIRNDIRDKSDVYMLLKYFESCDYAEDLFYKVFDNECNKNRHLIKDTFSSSKEKFFSKLMQYGIYQGSIDMFRMYFKERRKLPKSYVIFYNKNKLFTLKSIDREEHSFPGGRMKGIDKSLKETAKREVSEELSMKNTDVSYLENKLKSAYRFTTGDVNNLNTIYSIRYLIEHDLDVNLDISSNCLENVKCEWTKVSKVFIEKALNVVDKINNRIKQKKYVSNDFLKDLYIDYKITKKMQFIADIIPYIINDKKFNENKLFK